MAIAKPLCVCVCVCVYVCVGGGGGGGGWYVWSTGCVDVCVHRPRSVVCA